MATETLDGGDTLKLTPGESVRILSSKLDALVVEATYGSAGQAPPTHRRRRAADTDP